MGPHTDRTETSRRTGSDDGAPATAAEIAAAAGRLDPLLAGERLTTEGLTDAIYGRIFDEPHVDQGVFDAVREVAGLAGGALPPRAVSAAREAARGGYSGACLPLPGGGEALMRWERPTVYVEMRREGAYLALRVESHPAGKGRRVAWIHEIEATAREAIELLRSLADAFAALAARKAGGAAEGRPGRTSAAA